MDERNISGAELVLARYFAENTGEWLPVADIMQFIKGQHMGYRRAEIKEARKRLGIESQGAEGVFRWKWNNVKNPGDMWAEKSMEILGGDDNEGKRY